jgi:hypothetical protein
MPLSNHLTEALDERALRAYSLATLQPRRNTGRGSQGARQNFRQYFGDGDAADPLLS